MDSDLRGFNRVMVKASSILCAAVLAGCATSKRPALPGEQQILGIVPGYGADIRVWGDRSADDVSAEAALIKEQVAAHDAAAFQEPQAFLALSGGGQNGAFSAGLLTGWTEAGMRPKFRIVTGISTGAMIAPLAFLGSEYDDQLREMYTAHSTKDIFKARPVKGALWGKGMANSKPLARLIEKYSDDALIEAIAREHRKGRRLYVGTTNLDAGRPVVWDIGKIAASDLPNKGELIQQIILASGSIPGAFPPVMIEVEKEGVRYDEMHVDGGISYQIFFNPTSVRLGDFMQQAGFEGAGAVYVIRNALTAEGWTAVKPSTAAIAGTAIYELTINQGDADQHLIYLQSKLDGIDFNCARIPKEFNRESKGHFDRGFMTELFELARKEAQQGYPWSKEPL